MTLYVVFSFESAFSVPSDTQPQTYQSLARAFDPEGTLVYHEETLRRMWEMGKSRFNLQKQTEEQQTARKRMALFPRDSEVLFVAEDIWVVGDFPFFSQIIPFSNVLEV
jgi:hypothetical protein